MAARPPAGSLGQPLIARPASQHRPTDRSANGVAPTAARRPASPAHVPGGGDLRLFGYRLRTFDSFREPAFAWFFVSTLGQMYSAIGQMFVRSFLIYELTGSYAAMGLAAVAGAVPQFLLGPYGGVLADRYAKKSVTLVFQIIGFGNTFVIGTLAVLGVLEFWHLLVSAVFQGVLVALMVPARQAMVSEIVSRERIMNGVALNTAAMNLMQFTAPLLGGILLAAVGAGITFYVMAGCYAFATVTLLPVPSVPAQAAGGRGGLGEALRDIADGFRYMARQRSLRLILLLSFGVSALGMPFQGLLPGFVQDVFNADSALASLFMSFSAVGAFLAALLIASLHRAGRGKLLLAMGAIVGGATLAVVLSPWLWLSLPIMIFMGVGQAGRMTMASALVQELAQPAYRGRAMSVLMMQFSLMQAGVFILGLAAELVGIRWAVSVISIALLALIALFAAGSPALRRLQ